MLAELQSVFHTLEFEESGWLSAERFERDGERLVLTLRVETGVEREPPQRWRVTCEGVADFKLKYEAATDLDIVDGDYPTLWPYLHYRADLYCVGAPPADADALLGALYRVHQEATGAQLPFGIGLNALNALPHGAGLIASGPAPLIEVYENALRAHGVETSVQAGAPPLKWDGGQQRR